MFILWLIKINFANRTMDKYKSAHLVSLTKLANKKTALSCCPGVFRGARNKFDEKN